MAPHLPAICQLRFGRSFSMGSPVTLWIKMGRPRLLSQHEQHGHSHRGQPTSALDGFGDPGFDPSSQVGLRVFLSLNGVFPSREVLASRSGVFPSLGIVCSPGVFRSRTPQCFSCPAGVFQALNGVLWGRWCLLFPERCVLFPAFRVCMKK